MGFIFSAIALFAVWSSAFPLGKMALMTAPPIFLTAMRMMLSGSILCIYLFFRDRSALKIERAHYLPIFLYALLNIYLTNILESWGLQYLSSAKASFIYSLSPLFASFFSFLQFREKLTWKKALGLGLGIISFYPVLSMQTGQEKVWNVLGFLSWPFLAFVGATLASVYGWVLLRMLVKSREESSSLSPFTVNGVGMLLGGCMALVHSFLADGWHPTPVYSGQEGSFLQLLLSLSFISHILCYNFYGFLLKRFTATFLSFVGLLSPFFASLLGYLFLGEPFSWVILGSSCIILLGLWLVYSEELRQGYIVKKKDVEAST